MTNVPRPASESVSRSPRSPGEGEGPRPRQGEFERVLGEKSGPPAGPARPRSPKSGSDAEGGAGSWREQAAEEALRGRALPGDVAVAHPKGSSVAEAQTPPTVSAADRIAEIERIAEQIVQAAQVRLGPQGAAEARLELNMGRLGPMSVALERTAEGQIRIGFEAATAEASNLLQSRVGELAKQLEARGVALQEITIQSADQPLFRLEPATAAQSGLLSPRSEPGTAASPEGEGQRPPFEEQERQRRRDPQEVPSDDE